MAPGSSAPGGPPGPPIGPDRVPLDPRAPTVAPRRITEVERGFGRSNKAGWPEWVRGWDDFAAEFGPAQTGDEAGATRLRPSLLLGEIHYADYCWMCNKGSGRKRVSANCPAPAGSVVPQCKRHHGCVVCGSPHAPRL